jgi:hypothetical protein
MKRGKSKHRAEFLLRWSPLYLSIAFVVAALSLCLSPKSPIYLSAAVAGGLIIAVILVITWKLDRWEADCVLGVVIGILSGTGETWGRELAFPDTRFEERALWLLIQYFSTMFGAVFAVLAVFKEPIKRFVFGDAGSSEVRG